MRRSLRAATSSESFAVITADMCYPGWRESLERLAKPLEPQIME